MSGHSKWSTIKRKKGANDAQRAKEFTKIARLITVAAQNGGGDPSMNPTLALAMDKARAANMPNDNIDRAIKRGTGEGGTGGRLEEVSYETYAPSNVGLIIDCTTDNKNRTVGDLRSLVEKHGGRFADIGSISWQFNTIGNILLEFESSGEKSQRDNSKWNDKADVPKLKKEEAENLELEIYDLNGVLDVITDDFGMEIKTEYSELNNVKKFIDSKNIKISDAGLVKTTNTLVEIPDSERERVESFIEMIEEMDDVQKVWSNLKTD